MIPQKELDQLIQYYKGELTENALLNKAATLASKKLLLLADPQIPPALVNAKTKPLSQELTKLTKRIRQFPGGAGVGAPGGRPGEEGEEEEEGDLVTGPVEQWLKRMIKGSPSTPKPHITPSAKKGKAASTSKIPIKKGSPSTIRGDTDIRTRLEAIRERRKTLEKKLAESPWGEGKGKGKGKGPAREVEQLKPLPGWEDWARGKKLRRRLDYDDMSWTSNVSSKEEGSSNTSITSSSHWSTSLSHTC